MDNITKLEEAIRAINRVHRYHTLLDDANRIDLQSDFIESKISRDVRDVYIYLDSLLNASRMVERAEE